jgi:hypothetical protein
MGAAGEQPRKLDAPPGRFTYWKPGGVVLCPLTSGFENSSGLNSLDIICTTERWPVLRRCPFNGKTPQTSGVLRKSVGSYRQRFTLVKKTGVGSLTRRDVVGIMPWFI